MSVHAAVRDFVFLPALALAALLAAALAAPFTLAAADVYEGPARFARVRAIEGKIFIGHAYDSDFVELQHNDPVGEGDRLSLEKGARILLVFSDGSQLAAAGPTRVELLRLAPRRPFEVRLHEGEITVDTPDQRQLMVDSPEGAVTFEDDSRGDLELDAGGMRVSVQRGTALAGDDAGESLSAGDRVVMQGGQPGDTARAGIGDGQALYGWMNSAGRNDEPAAPAAGEPQRSPGGRARRGNSADRNRVDEYDSGDGDGEDTEHDLRDSRRELPPEVDSYYDELSAYGRWRFVPGYGWAWRPHRVARGWVPFTAGFWRSTPWGMFWVSSEPWGWAPYRYGSWRFEPRWGWFWVPGPRFGGAWVVFYGEGDTWGWCPAYYDGGDWYPSYTTYIQINVVNIYNYHPPFQIINRPPMRRPILGRPPMPVPPLGGGFNRHPPPMPRTDRRGGGGPDFPPVRPAAEVWRPRPVLGEGHDPRPDENGGRPVSPGGRPSTHGSPGSAPRPGGAPDNPPIGPKRGGGRLPPGRTGGPDRGNGSEERPPASAPEPRRHPARGEAPPESVPRRAPHATRREPPAPMPPESGRREPQPEQQQDSAPPREAPAASNPRRPALNH